MATQTNFPTVGANLTGVGTEAWSNTGNIVSDNNTHATQLSFGTAQTNYLKATGFGFSIPAGSTINGIALEIERTKSSPNAVTDTAVRIVKANTVLTTQTYSGDVWTQSFDVITYGGPTSLWGTTWTASDINDANFGAVMSATATSGNTLYVDFFRITVYYTVPNSAFFQLL